MDNDLMRVVRKAAELERKIDHLYRHLGIEPPPPPAEGEFSAQVRQLVEQGNEMGAIKQYRAETGAGLAEARDAVQRLATGGPGIQV